MSRVAVREAIRTLESNGLLMVKKGPKGGIFVVQDYERPIVDTISNLLASNEMTLENLFEVRLLIEPYAAARVAEIGTEADFDLLEKTIDEAQREHDANVSVRHRYIDFHRQILRLTRNPLLSIVGESALLVTYERVKEVISADTSPAGLAMHQKLVRALRKRAPAEARRIMTKDLDLLGRRFAELSEAERRSTPPKRRR